MGNDRIVLINLRCNELLLNSLSNVRHPSVSLLFAGGVDLVHLWLIGRGTNKKHGFLLVGHFPDYQLLERDHWWLIILSKIKQEGQTTALKRQKSIF